MTTGLPLLEVQDLHVTYRAGGQATAAVRGVSFSLARGRRWRLWVSRGRASRRWPMLCWGCCRLRHVSRVAVCGWRVTM